MSGGKFNYASYRLSEFVELLGDFINSNDIPDEEGNTSGYSDETLHYLNKIRAQAAQLPELMKATEFLYSGDHGEESFIEICKEKMAEKEAEKGKVVALLSGGNIQSAWSNNAVEFVLIDEDNAAAGDQVPDIDEETKGLTLCY